MAYDYIWVRMKKNATETKVWQGDSNGPVSQITPSTDKSPKRKRDVKVPGDKTKGGSTISATEDKQVLFKTSRGVKRGKRDVTCCYRDARTGEEWCW